MPEPVIDQIRSRVEEARGRLQSRAEEIRGRLRMQRQRLIGEDLRFLRGNPHPAVLEKLRERIQSRAERFRRREFPLLGMPKQPAAAPERPGFAGAGKPVPPAVDRITRPAVGGDAREIEEITRPVIGGG